MQLLINVLSRILMVSCVINISNFIYFGITFACLLHLGYHLLSKRSVIVLEVQVIIFSDYKMIIVKVALQLNLKLQ